MSIWYLWLDDLYGWWTTPPTPPPSPVTIVHRKIEITDSFIDELKLKLAQRRGAIAGNITTT